MLDLRWLRKRITQAEGWWFDARHHVQTSGYVPLNGLTLSGEEKSGFEYLPTRPSVVRRILKRLPIQNFSEYTFVDLGSGKGRILLIAAQYPFRKIQGVEFALELHLQAEKNIACDSHRARRKCPDVESINVDAAKYLFPKGNLVLYLFNPFGIDVLTKVLSNLAASLAENPRHVVVIALSPEYRVPAERVPTLRLHSQARNQQIYQTDATTGAERAT